MCPYVDILFAQNKARYQHSIARRSLPRVCDWSAKDNIIPFKNNNMVGFVSQIKCTISYKFFIDGQEFDHKIQVTPKVYDYLIDKFDLVVAYNKISGKSALVKLVYKTPN